MLRGDAACLEEVGGDKQLARRALLVVGGRDDVDGVDGSETLEIGKFAADDPERKARLRDNDAVPDAAFGPRDVDELRIPVVDEPKEDRTGDIQEGRSHGGGNEMIGYGELIGRILTAAQALIMIA
jgi:hypothetical protein